MNTKKQLRLASSILAIAVGSIMSILSIINTTIDLSSVNYYTNVNLFIIFSIIFLLLSISILILGSIFISKNSKGTAISLLIMSCILILFQILVMLLQDSTMGITFLVMILISATLIVILTSLYLGTNNSLEKK